MFGETGKIEEELTQLIFESLTQRRIDTRGACDSNAYLSVAWDMREDIYMPNIDLVRSYMRDAKQVKFIFEGEEVKVDIVKAGMRAKDGQGTLLFQYQLATRLKPPLSKRKKDRKDKREKKDKKDEE